MSKVNETLVKAYGNVPKEPVGWIDFEFQPIRFTKFHWLKFLRKFILGR